MTAARSGIGLTTDELAALAAGLAAGKRMTVYLRDPLPSLSLDAGTSARVVSIDGSTVTVSPKGVDDQLPFEAEELQRSRTTTTSTAPRRKPNRSSPAPAPAPPAEPSANRTTSPTKAVQPTPTPATSPATTPGTSPTPGPSRNPRRTKPSTGAVSVVITSTADSTWTIAVSHGAKQPGKPVEVTADRVARAMRELGDETAIAAVDGVIDAAREAAQNKIDELSRDLENARAALAALGDQDRP